MPRSRLPLAERDSISAEIRRADELLPIRNRLRQIEEWRARISTPDVVAQLPESVGAVYERLSQRVASAKETVDGLTADKEQLHRQQAILTSEDEQILARSDEIDRWVRQISVHEQGRSSLAELDRQEERLTAAIRETSGAVFRQPWDDAYADAVESVVLPDLKACISAFEERQGEAETRAAEARVVEAVHVSGALPGWASLVGATIGAVLLVVGLVSSSGVWLGVAVFLLLAAGYNFYQGRQRKLLEKREAVDREQRAGHLRDAEEERDRARQTVKEALGDLPVAEALLSNPDLTLYQTIEKLHRLCAEIKQLRTQHQEQETRWQTRQDELAGLMTALGVESTTPEAFRQIERSLAVAREHEQTRREATHRIAQIDAVLPEREQQLAEAERELDQFVGQLGEAVGADLRPEELLTAATDLQRLATRIREAEEELESQHPNLADLVAEVQRIEGTADDAWSFDPVEVERQRDRLQEVQRELEELREEKGRLDNEIESARGQVSVGELDGEIARLEEEMEEVARQRDRLMLLACLREADRLFREQHQPDVLRRAGDYLRTITDGRYKALTMMTSDDGIDRLVVASEDGDVRLVEPPLSGGTLDQIYLSFRLAVIDHLDEGHEALPLLLDEALINWDDHRLEHSARILGEASERHQIFLFTCHRWLAERMAVVTEAPIHEFVG